MQTTMELAKLREEAAQVEKYAASLRVQAVQLALEEARTRVKLAEVSVADAATNRVLEELRWQHEAGADGVHVASCRARHCNKRKRRSRSAAAEEAAAEAAAVAAVASARAEVGAARGRHSRAERDVVAAQRRTAEAAQEVERSRREHQARTRQLDDLRDEQKACKALQVASRRTKAEWEKTELCYRPFSMAAAKGAKPTDKGPVDDPKTFPTTLGAAPCLRALDVFLPNLKSRPVPQDVLEALAAAPVDIKKVVLWFDPNAPAIQRAVLALLGRVRPKVEELSVKTTAGAMPDADVRAFWGLVETSPALRSLTLTGPEEGAGPLFRKGPFAFRQVSAPRALLSLDAEGLPGHDETMLVRLLRAYGPSLTTLRLPRKLADSVRRYYLKAVVTYCPGLEELALPGGAGLSYLLRCAKLRRLHLLDFKVNDAASSWHYLTKQAAFVARLDTLSIGSIDNDLGSSVLLSAANLKSLRSLAVGTHRSLRQVLAGLPRLEELHWDGINNPDRLQDVRPKNARNLKVVSVKYSHPDWIPVSGRRSRRWHDGVQEMKSAFGGRLRVSDLSEGLPDPDSEDSSEEDSEVSSGEAAEAILDFLCSSDPDADSSASDY